MKKLFSTFVSIVLLFVFSATQAQDELQNTTPVREAVMVDYFTKERDIPVLYMEKIRAQLIEGFKIRNRMDVIDAEYIPAMAPRGAGMYNPAVNYEQSRNEAIQNSGARYIVSGHVSEYKYTRTLVNNKPQFTSVFKVVLNGYDMLTGEELSPEQYDLTGIGSNMDEADRRAIQSITGRMNYYIEHRFKFQTEILDICPPDAKGRTLELYIGAGKSMGVKPGDQFLVYEVNSLEGRSVRSELGRITVHSVDGAEVSKCSMKKKQAPAIIDAFRSGKTMIAVSDGEALFF